MQMGTYTNGPGWLLALSITVHVEWLVRCPLLKTKAQGPDWFHFPVVQMCAESCGCGQIEMIKFKSPFQL